MTCDFGFLILSLLLCIKFDTIILVRFIHMIRKHQQKYLSTKDCISIDKQKDDRNHIYYCPNWHISFMAPPK
jgi:hypothetical protein